MIDGFRSYGVATKDLIDKLQSTEEWPRPVSSQGRHGMESILFDPETKEGVVVDPGGDVDVILQTVRDNGLTLKAIWWR